MLRGFEGAGAARWYGEFTRRLGKGFHFERRVAPHAEDPVNVLLNIAQTVLYRHAALAIQAVGLVPSIGFFHTPRARFQALAADFQEPFRHLMDRAVIQATHQLAPAAFQRTESGPFALRLSWEALRQFYAMIERLLLPPVSAAGEDEPRTYREQLLRQARSLRRWLLDPAQPFQAFVHPAEGSPP